MNISFYTTDVFTNKAFGGAQIAVVPEAENLNVQQMQTIASEFNLSETVFVVSSDPSDNRHKLRLFSPLEEVDFGSHTSVAAAHVLATTGKLPLTHKHTQATFELNSGELDIHVSQENGKPTLTQFTLSTKPVIDNFLPIDEELAKIISLDQTAIENTKFKPLLVSSKGIYMVIPVKGFDKIYDAAFDFEAWSRVSNKSSSNILLFSTNTESASADFHLRLLGPKIGPQEDPPVGAAIPSFGAYLCAHEHVLEGTYSFTVERGQQNLRQSLIQIEMDNKPQEELTLRVGGSAVMICEGKLNLP